MAVDLSFYKSYIAEEIRDEGREEGLEEGLEKGRALGRAEDILFVLEQRGIEVPDEARDRVIDCDDPDLLRQWFARALTAATVEDIFDNE